MEREATAATADTATQLLEGCVSKSETPESASSQLWHPSKKEPDAGLVRFASTLDQHLCKVQFVAVYENLLLIPYVLLICSASDKSGWVPFESIIMAVDFVIELLFALTVAMRFRTTIVDEDHYEVMEREAIHAKLWKDSTMWADLVSLALTPCLWASPPLNALGVARLLRVWRFWSVSSDLYQASGGHGENQISEVLSCVASMFVFCHSLACTYFAVLNVEEGPDAIETLTQQYDNAAAAYLQSLNSAVAMFTGWCRPPVVFEEARGEVELAFAGSARTRACCRRRRCSPGGWRAAGSSSRGCKGRRRQARPPRPRSSSGTRGTSTRASSNSRTPDTCRALRYLISPCTRISHPRFCGKNKPQATVFRFSSDFSSESILLYLR